MWTVSTLSSLFLPVLSVTKRLCIVCVPPKFHNLPSRGNNIISEIRSARVIFSLTIWSGLGLSSHHSGSGWTKLCWRAEDFHTVAVGVCATIPSRDSACLSGTNRGRPTWDLTFSPYFAESFAGGQTLQGLIPQNNPAKNPATLEEPRKDGRKSIWWLCSVRRFDAKLVDNFSHESDVTSLQDPFTSRPLNCVLHKFEETPS